LVILAILFFWVSYSGKDLDAQISPYPDGKNFAFTITDDPDGQRLEKIQPIYDFLSRVGFRTTIVVWVKNALRSDGYPEKAGQVDYGETCQNKDYLLFVKDLQNKGFEVAMHTASGGNDRREDTIEGYEEFKRHFGNYPKMNIMHASNLENVYWGKKAANNKFVRWLIGIFSEKAKLPFQGEIPDSPYFWGDILKEKTKYVRLWGTSNINTLKANPSMPYHDLDKPYVNFWHSFSDGWTVKRFNRLISDENLQKLQQERGASIVYTHFARGFANKNADGVYRLDPIFKRQMQRLSQLKDGWFVPASNLLDRLLLMKNLSVFKTGKAYIIVNSNPIPIDGVTLIFKNKKRLLNIQGNTFETNSENEIVFETIAPQSSITLFENSNDQYLEKNSPDAWESTSLFFSRVFIFLAHRFGDN
jgi:hypothetical protein